MNLIPVDYLVFCQYQPTATDRHISRLMGNLFLLFVALVVYAVYKIVRSALNSHKAKTQVKAKTADDARVAALDELERGTMDRRLWARAIEESNGDDARARSIYIRLRAQER